MINEFESRIARLFKARGYYTIVSAGSRGVADVIAINKDEVLFIQCKRNRNLTKAEEQQLTSAAFNVGAKALVAICRKRRLLIKQAEQAHVSDLIHK